MMTHRNIAFAALAMIVCIGCRNPFDPEADIRVNRFLVQGANYVGVIVQTEAIASITGGVANVRNVSVVLDNYSTVRIILKSYNVIYRQVGPQNSATCTLPAGSAICSLGENIGKRYYLHSPMGAVNSSTAVQRRIQVTIPLRIITEEFLEYVDAADPSDIQAGGIDCIITLHGIDDNGHNITAEGTMHIEVL